MHIVRRGETLSAIALRYGVTVAAIVQANGLSNPRMIYAGQRLVLPMPGRAAAPPANDPGTGQVIHVVEPGDTTSAIAQRYGVTVAAIVQANGLTTPNRIIGGQRLVIPARRETAAPAVAPDVAELAAIIYAEAQADPVDFNEMLAIASVVRNRVEHVAAYPSDQRWFGGPGYHAVLSNRREFPSYGTARYASFLAGAFGSPREQVAAASAMQAATQVQSGGAPYSFVFFQQAATRPSVRAAAPAVKLGAHRFWSFRPDCVDPATGCHP